MGYGALQCIASFVHWTINHRIQSPNNRSKLFILFSILMCLETKFYIFWKLFTIFLDLLKIAVFQTNLDHKKTTIFNKSKKIVKKFQKNVKFGLQTHINIENKMNGSDRLLEFWKLKYWVVARRLSMLRVAY